MTPYEQCFDELGLQAPTVEQKRALRRLVAALTPTTKELAHARETASCERKRRRENEARCDVMREAIEDCLNHPKLPWRVRRKLQGISDACCYDGRTKREIVLAAGSVT